MPRTDISAKRYAQAIFQIALEKEEPERWKEELNRLREIALRPALLTLLENPKLSVKERTSLLKEIVRDINPMVLNLVGLLIFRGKIKLLDEIIGEYERLMFKYYGVEMAELITAIPLDEAGKDSLEERLSQALGKKLKLSYRVEPGILGGVIVRAEDWLFDGSVKSKLEGLRKSLVSKQP